MKLAFVLLSVVLLAALTSAHNSNENVVPEHHGYIGKKPHTTQNQSCWVKCTHEKDHLGNREEPSHVLSICKSEFDQQEDPDDDYKGPLCRNALNDCANNCKFEYCQILGDLAENNHWLDCGNH